MYKSIFLLALGLCSQPAPAQSFELQQLTLDISKLAQLKTILQDMYTYYAILYKGYEEVKDIARGNFELHLAFLSGLLAVSDNVSEDPQVAAIVANQTKLVQLYGSLLSRWNADPYLTPDERTRVSSQAADVLEACTEDLDELTMVLTDGALRMSDDERLTAISRIHRDVNERLTSLRSLDVLVARLSAGRRSRATNAQTLQNLYGQ
jgi:hypothetical protein